MHKYDIKLMILLVIHMCHLNPVMKIKIKDFYSLGVLGDRGSIVVRERSAGHKLCVLVDHLNFITATSNRSTKQSN